MLALAAVGLSALARPICFVTIFLQFVEIKNLQFSKLLTSSDLCYVKNIDNFYIRVFKKSTRPIFCNFGFFSGSQPAGPGYLV